MSHINLITTCTNGKNSQGKEILSLSQFSSDRTPAKVLVRSWSNALNEVISTSETVCAIDLYKGGHWSMAKSILERYAVDLWVLSAGLGLLHYKDKVAPYNATFATGYEESIPLYSKEYVGKSFHKTWWKELTERSLFKSQHPTSIAELMKNNNQGYFIICGSPDYINAIELDAIHGLEYLREPKKQLLIITSKEISGNLSNYLFKTNKKMAEWLKCNMLMLNISMAKYIIHEFTTKKIDNLNALSQYLSSELQKLPERENKKGIRRNSEEVSHFIVQILQRNPGISATQALRTFRDSGNSFEEKRFRAFFKALSGSKP